MDIPGRLRAEEQSSAIVGSPNISTAAEAAELKEQEEGHRLNTPWTMWIDKSVLETLLYSLTLTQQISL